MNATSGAPVNAPAELHDRPIGDLIRDARNLSAAEVEKVLSYQREHGVRFGEAAITLGLASPDDVLNALAQQFHYPLANAERRLASPELVTLLQPFSVQAEAIRAVRSQVTMRLGQGEAARQALAVISPASGDGKTYFAANLAVSLAQLGGRTLIIDADLRGPRQHEVFKVSNSAGLSTLLSGRAENQLIQTVEGVSGLFVLPCGPIPPNPLELIERPAFALLIRELSTKFDHVVIDTAAASLGADACVVAARCGAALVLTRKNENKISALQDLVASLAGSSAQLLGAVVNEF
ncbi:CpsD/CapB family tyrosine-protein kinase [Roseateles saccharophilus]|uniref:Chain length determinant protein tyrosine kinase EpsG n=1 Tax=Roseateles saccharophilus TaxID=304 RepID=A0A4R3UQ04_ROSSA|nr:polysaccharide biosynthesis tyrosine autokinase [Roseateles saccharophilus]TCU93092.1 chain length determinant protein tyrosine kinase EpsG [Roseateles saccharophilus]